MRASGHALEPPALTPIAQYRQTRLGQRRSLKGVDQQVEAFAVRQPSDGADQELRPGRAELGTPRRDFRLAQAARRNHRFVDAKYLAAIVARDVALLPVGNADETVHGREVAAIDRQVQGGDGGGIGPDARQQAGRAPQVRVYHAGGELRERSAHRALRPPFADFGHLNRRIEPIEDARSARAAMVAPDDQQHRMVAAMGVAHLGRGAFGAGETTREEHMGNAHATMIATFDAVFFERGARL